MKSDRSQWRCNSRWNDTSRHTHDTFTHIESGPNPMLACASPNTHCRFRPQHLSTFKFVDSSTEYRMREKSEFDKPASILAISTCRHWSVPT